MNEENCNVTKTQHHITFLSKCYETINTNYYTGINKYVFSFFLMDTPFDTIRMAIWCCQAYNSTTSLRCIVQSIAAAEASQGVAHA